mgnify:CR=1 FL=1
MTKKRMTVKNVKYSDFASHETLCFQCSLYWDGVKVAMAENDGRGGETFVSFDDRKTEEKVRAWEQKQPKIVTDLPSNNDEDEFFSYPFSIEGAIDTLVGEFLQQRDLKRLLKRELVLQDNTLPAGDYYGWKLKNYPDLTPAQLAKRILTKWDPVKKPVVLNLLPLDEAEAIWRKA